MRALLSIAFVLLLVVGIVGFNRGWFQLTTREEPGRKVDVNLRVDPELIHRDVEHVKQEASEAIK